MLRRPDTGFLIIDPTVHILRASYVRPSTKLCTLVLSKWHDEQQNLGDYTQTLQRTIDEGRSALQMLRKPGIPARLPSGMESGQTGTPHGV
ncbi:hypothetical protein A6U86_33915 [Rhizobium sp. AC27/96]|nr:hypothetical protein A6U86_33915 [Rhizobium sp. AC27/96]